MGKQTRNNLYRAGLAILSGCVLCLVANIVLVMMIRHDMLFDSNKQARRNISTEILQELKQEGNTVERSLLIDSILSIVQSYYVDHDRVRNENILDYTFAALSLHPEITYERTEQQSTITVGDVERSFPVRDNPTYRETLKGLVSVAGLIDSQLNENDAERQWQDKAEVMIVNSLLSALDAHSALLSPESYRELRQGTEGSFGGLGVLVGIREKILTVIKPLPRSPALRAGVQQEDRILSIDGNHTFGYGLDELVEYMRGDPGTLVRLMVLREGEKHPQMVNLTREVIKVDSVEASVVDHSGLKILLIKIENFSSRTSQEVVHALTRHRSKFGHVDGVVLDLRSNPGGLLDQAVAVSNVFLEEGVILTTKGRRQEVESANAYVKEVDFPVMILINGDSASASEIVSGALQDHDRAVVIGQPSFGKGSVQTIFELPNEQALKLTIARYYTPLGTSIQNVGIKPDIWVHPVIQRDKNKNLLGSMRYKNERYLPNRLEAVAQPLNGTHHYRNFKGYYLIKKEMDAYDLVREEDIELDVAKTVIASVRKSHGKSVEAGGLRAGHWLALAAPEINKQIGKYDDLATAWLAKSKNIDWQANESSKLTGAGLDLEVANDQIIPAVVGSNVTIPWKLANRGSAEVRRISLFVNSSSAAFETQEFLVGTVKPGALESGFIEFKLPSYLQEGHLPISVSFAIDAMPVSGSMKQITLILKEKKAATLDTYVTLTDEVGGKQDGTLEPGERARLKIVVANGSQFDAKKIRTKVVNLSGAQVDVGKVTEEIAIVRGGKQRIIYIDIMGSKQLYTNELEFGLALESDDLLEPVLRSVTLSGLPNMGELKEVTSLSH